MRFKFKDPSMVL